MVEFRVLSPDDVPWSALDAFEDRVVFQTREWLDFIAASQGAAPLVAEVRDGSEVVGYFSGLIVRKLGVPFQPELAMVHPLPGGVGRLVLGDDLVRVPRPAERPQSLELGGRKDEGLAPPPQVGIP